MADSLMTNWISRVFPFLLLAPAVLPLAVSGGLYYPYLFPKVILFYALILLTLAAFAYISTRGAAFYFSRLKYKVAWIPSALLLLAYFTSITGVDFYKSFWSIFGRGDGLLMLTLSVISFYLILVSADRMFFNRFVRTIAVVGTMVALWGVVEWFLTGGRIGSSIGNPAFLAGYLALSFFVTLIARIELPVEWRRFAYAGAALQLIAIFLTATRGTMLALFIVAVIALIFCAYTENGKARRLSIIGLLVVSALIAGFFLFRENLDDSSIVPVARLAQISANDTDIAHRLFVWKNMTNEVARRPFLGYGAEHISYLFDRFYDPGAITEEWFDRSHNAYLDYAAQFGVVGAILYLMLIGSLLWTAFQHWKRDKRIGLLIAYAAITYAIQNFFVFDTISSWWLFIALLAVLLAQVTEDRKTKLTALNFPFIGTAVSMVLVISIIPISIFPLVANYDLTMGYYYHVIDVPRANGYFENGLALHTYGDLEYGYQLHTMYTEQQSVRTSGQDRVSAYEMAKKVLMENYERYPYDARTAIYLAHVLDSAPPETPADPELVRAVVIRALALSPKRAQTWYVLANLSIGPAKDLPIGPQKTARYQEAIKILEGYASLVPTLAETHYILADLYTAIGDVSRAKKEADIGHKYYKENLTVARRAALFYERIQNWELAEFYLQSVVNQDEKDFVFYYDLAKVKYMLGDYAAALKIVNDLRASNPEILPTDKNFLNAITAYEQTQK